MKTGRTVVRLGPLFPALAALSCAPPGFSWDTYAVDGFNSTMARAPWAAYQRGDTVVLPEITSEPGAPRGELQQQWYAPVEGPQVPAYVESRPVGTFRPLESAPPPMDWGYQGYRFRPLGSQSRPHRAPAGSRPGAGHSSPGAQIEPNRHLPGTEWYSDYGRGSPHFSFRPDRQPVQQRSKGYDSYDPTQPAVGTDYRSGIQDIPSTGYYAPRTVDGPQADRW